MASVAMYRDDTSGSLATGGTATAYTLTTNQVYGSLSALDGAELSFKATTTNGASVTLAVDGLTAKPIVSSTGVAVPTGALVAGSVYTVTYVNASNEFRLHAFYDPSAIIPSGMVAPFAAATAPSGWLLCFGQAVSRSTYATLFAVISTTYGIGDGSTTFNLPDLRGRAVFGDDDMGGSAAGRLTATTMTADGVTLGATGGAQTVTLSGANLPAYTPAGTINTPTITITGGTFGGTSASAASNIGAGGGPTIPITATAIAATSQALTFTGAAQGGTATAVNKMPPAIILAYIIKT